VALWVIREQKENSRSLKGLLSRTPRPTLAAILLIPVLLLIDAFCYQITLPVTIDIQHGTGTLTVGSTRLALGKKLEQPQDLQFVPHNPLVHEYQLDGSDSTNNLDMDTTYLSQIASSPYYRVQAWMRDLDGTSRWRDLEIQANGREVTNIVWPTNGAKVTLPVASDIHVSLQLQRPETPMSLNLVLRGGRILQITLDRNNRQVTVSDLDTGSTIAGTFFLFDAAPFAAMVVDTLARILLWAVVLLLLVQACEMGIGLARRRAHRQLAKAELASVSDLPAYEALPASASNNPRQKPPLALMRKKIHLSVQKLFQALHPVALIALGCSLVYVIWIAVVEYQGQPHIYDASAYLFAAKMYAGGRLWVPAPPLSDLFPGGFMVIWNGRWFAQYDPGTSLTLAPGVLLGVPWLVEPVLGTLALLGIGLIAARLYNRRVATVAVLLGCLSPFYSYLAASYLSHTIALFYLVWGFWALLRFVQGGRGWNMLLCGLCFGMAALTRDLVALLYVAILVPGVVLIHWQRGKWRLRFSRLAWWLALLLVGIVFANLYLVFNFLVTGDPLLTPRSLFFAGDVWGFGPGIGFYGQHTLAAGFVNLDELLTILQIDLFGWPFYLTLAFLVMPFLTGRARKADWFLLIALIVTAGSYIGYFYHGIYLGPRYLFEDLPFLLILSARGILALGAWGIESGQAAARWLRKKTAQSSFVAQPAISLVTLVLVGALICCNLFYYLPRQAARYQNYTGLPDGYQVYTGLPDGYKLDTSQIYQSPVHHAIVVTDNQVIYQLVLFPLNDPELKGDVIYALGYETTQFAQLRKAFPGRALYLLVINPDGSVRYILLSS
jgi:hypothetical protein